LRNAAAARDERDSRDVLALFYLVALFSQVSPVPIDLWIADAVDAHHDDAG